MSRITICTCSAMLFGGCGHSTVVDSIDDMPIINRKDLVVDIKEILTRLKQEERLDLYKFLYNAHRCRI